MSQRQSHPLASGLEAADSARTLSVDLTGGFEPYWEARPATLKHHLLGHAKRLADAGLQTRVTVVCEPADVALAVARYEALARRAWPGGRSTSVDLNPAPLVACSELMARSAADGTACVHELWIDADMVASLPLIADHRRVVALTSVCDERFDSYAPGQLLLHHALRSAFERWPGAVFEFHADAALDQRPWATAQRAPSGSEPGEPGAAIAVFEQADDLPADVQELLATAERESVSFGRDWYRNFLATVPMPGTLRLFYVLRRGGRAVVVMPVLVKRGRLPGHRHVESMTNYYSALYAPALHPALTSADLALLVRRIAADHARVSTWRFAPMDPTCAAYDKLVEGLRLAGMLPFPFFSFGNWYLRTQGDWQGYLATRHGKLRNTIKRMARKLTQDGGTLEVVADAAGLERAIAAYGQVYGSSWKVPEPYPGFIPGLMRLCAAKGWLRLGLVWLGGQPIAAQLWIVANGKAEIYKVAYDEAYKAYSPGTVLTAHLMRHVFEQDAVVEVDYLIGDDPYKKSWMNERRERWGIVAYNPRSVGGLWGAAREALGRRLKPWLARFRTRDGLATKP